MDILQRQVWRRFKKVVMETQKMCQFLLGKVQPEEFATARENWIIETSVNSS